MVERRSFDIATETLKQLVAKNLPPTPGNYQTMYNEIAGLPHAQPFLADFLREISQSLPLKTPGQQRYKGLLDEVALESQALATKNHGVATTSYPEWTAEFFIQIAQWIEYAVPALGEDDPRFSEQTAQLLARLRQQPVDALLITKTLANYGHHLACAAQDQAAIGKRLLKLLRLLFQNFAELSTEEQWLKGQMEALLVLTEQPLRLHHVDAIESLLQGVISKQKDAKYQSIAVQDEMRYMLASFFERLSQMTESTSVYQYKLEGSARLIEQAKNLAEISPVLKEVVDLTREMTKESQISREQLSAMQARSKEVEIELAKLHLELDRVSLQARHDALTGALNRKGLDEALKREISTMRRNETRLSVALLDIDNFKKLNDSLGHATGDGALTHLASVVRACLRPQDTLARYGGEEFVVLLPDTPLEKGMDAMRRLQRELSMRCFHAGSEKLLITFSAGVAQLLEDEESSETIRRADQAMYAAKRAGKNCVMGM